MGREETDAAQQNCAPRHFRPLRSLSGQGEFRGSIMGAAVLPTRHSFRNVRVTQRIPPTHSSFVVSE